MNKWSTQIEECLRASLEHGPDAMFKAPNVGLEFGITHIYNVLLHSNLQWRYAPPQAKPDIEQWGNEYADGDQIIYWRNSLDETNDRDSPDRIALQHRIVDRETGKTKLFETLEVFK